MIVTIAGSAFSFSPNQAQLDGINIELAAFDGTIGSGQFPVPDPSAAASMVTGRQFKVVQDFALLSDGFIIDNDRGRGPFRVGSQREYGVSIQDANALLGGFRVTRTRPAETDYARVIAFAALDGPAWDTTWVLNASTVTMPVRKYDSDGGWSELITDLVEFTGKTLFLHDKAGGGRCLHYHLLTNGHTCGLSISDVTVQGGTVFNPAVPLRQRTSVDLRNDILGRDQSGRTSPATDATSITAHNADGLLHQALMDFSATSQADLDLKTAAFLASQKNDYDTYTCTLEALDGTALGKMRVGDLITVTSSVMGLSASVQRIAHLRYKFNGASNLWDAELELGAPVRRRARVRVRTGVPTTPFVCTPTDFTLHNISGLTHMDCIFSGHGDGQSCISSASGSDTMLVYDGVTYRIDYLVYHAPDSNGLNAYLSTVGGAYIGTPGPGVGAGTETAIYMGDKAHHCTFLPPNDIPAASVIWTVSTGGPASISVQAALVENACSAGDSYASTISATITYITGANDPRFATLPICSNGPPVSGQTTKDASFLGDGTTTSFTTVYPYQAGSLHVEVNGLDWTNIPLVVTETDPTTGAYTVAYPFPLGATVLISYRAA